MPTFDRIRYRGHDGSMFLYAFDLIELNGDDLGTDPLEIHKATLANVAPTMSRNGAADQVWRNPTTGNVLLRPRRERPGSRAAEQRDELAADHLITSSAVICMIGGTVRPSSFAVLRLIASSYWSR
jgi:hypothetical protein